MAGVKGRSGGRRPGAGRKSKPIPELEARKIASRLLVRANRDARALKARLEGQTVPQQ